MIPEGFREIAEESLGKETAEALLAHLDDEPQVSVRANTAKLEVSGLRMHFGGNADSGVEWSPAAFYLKDRPSFTMDPWFHAGGYYVQEASSMYVGHMLKSIIGEASGPLRLLDLCAAPGGKTTDILSLLRKDDLLVTNEVMRNRATVLAENVARWGAANAVVTSNDPSEFKALGNYFDIAVIDAPCSGEGMFRKDPKAVAEWSEENVRICAARQRRIIADIWKSIKCGGYIIYSTCTFNRFEDEDNAVWIASELGAELIEQRHFLPGRDRGEGFYCALLRKSGQPGTPSMPKARLKAVSTPASTFTSDGFVFAQKGNLIKAYPATTADETAALESCLKVIRSGVAVATVKGRDLIPEADLALSTALRRGAFAEVALSREDALRFLAKEALSFPQEPHGFLLLTFEGLPLGFVKNLGNRSNNLLPSARRIRMDITSEL